MTGRRYHRGMTRSAPPPPPPPAPELDLLQGTLDVLVLRALSWGPMHGYAVARFIRSGSDGSFKVLDGALYTSLHRMEERGWVESQWGTSEKGKRAKFYRLTPAGRRALRSETASWNDYVAAVARVMRATPAPA
jgi:PadR family transcriptional regulator